MSDRRFEFRVLGPLEAYRDGERIALAGARQRAALAVLLLNANRVVSRERLARELQYDQPDADHALRIQISRLRKSLGEGTGSDSRLVTRAPGYMLRVEDGELDVDRFNELVVAGRDLVERGDTERGVDALRQAEMLWRGPALADVEPRAAEGDALEEQRLGAIEQRVEAELALGRHAALVPELEALVAKFPLREGVRAQLMLALYRCGRQADALATHRAGRALLDDELGLRPGRRLQELEQAILRQDPSLDPPAVGRPAAVRLSVPSRPPSRLMPGVAVAAVLAAAAAGVTLAFHHDGRRAPHIRGDAVAFLSAAGRASAVTRLDAAPSRIVIGDGSLWATQVDAGTVVRIDLATNTVRQTIRVGRGPVGIAIAAHDVWVVNSLDGTVSRIDPVTNSVVQTIAVGAEPSAAVTVGRSIWIVNRGDDNVMQLDSATGRVRRVINTGAGPNDAAAVDHTIWVADEGDGTVTRIDSSTGQVVDTIHVGDAPSAIAANRAGVWVADGLDATVSRIDPGTEVVTTTSVAGQPVAIVALGSAAVVADRRTGGLLRVDTEGGGAVPIAEVGEGARTLASVGSRLWVGVATGGAGHFGGSLRIAATGAPTSLDPALEDGLSPLQLLDLTNDGLVTLDHAGGPAGAQLVPDLALSLPRSSDGGRTYSFRLRRGVRYSTRGEVMAGDVRATFERLFELRSAGRSLYEDIRGASKCLRTTVCDLSRGIVTSGRNDIVTFHLRAPDPDFLYKLTEPYSYVLPRSTPRRAAHSPLPATGPYTIASFQPGRELRLIRNPRFREWSTAAQPAGYPDVVTWKFGLTPSVALQLVERGRADLLQNLLGIPLTKRERSELQTRFPSRVHTNPAIGTDFYSLNTRTPPFDQLRVRRAFNFAVDRGRFVALAGGKASAQPTCQILPPHMPGYRPYCPYTRGRRGGRWEGPDLAVARRLVTASRTKGMRVVIWDTPGPGGRDPGGRYLVSVLRQLGFRASLRLLPDSAFLRYTDDSRHHAQVASGGWGADYPSPSSMMSKLSCAAFIPGGGRTFNDSEFCDQSLDRQIERAESLNVTEHGAALRAWGRLDREFTDRAIWLPTITTKQTDVVSGRIGNYEYNPFWGVLVDQLWVR